MGEAINNSAAEEKAALALRLLPPSLPQRDRNSQVRAQIPARVKYSRGWRLRHPQRDP